MPGGLFKTPSRRHIVAAQRPVSKIIGRVLNNAPGTVYPGPDTETTTNGGPLILICRRPGAWSGQRPRAGCRVWFDRERGNPQAPRTSGLRRGGFFDMRVCV